MKIIKISLFLFACSAFILSSCSSAKSPFNTWNEKEAKPIENLSADTAYSSFMKHFKKDVENHNWSKVMDYFDAENFKSQQHLGIDTSQYIQEGLGLNFVNNVIKKKEKDKTKFSQINNIKEITFNSYKYSNNDLIEIFGSVATFDDEELYVRIYCKKNENVIKIIPPLG